MLSLIYPRSPTPDLMRPGVASDVNQDRHRPRVFYLVRAGQPLNRFLAVIVPNLLSLDVQGAELTQDLLMHRVAWHMLPSHSQ